MSDRGLVSSSKEISGGLAKKDIYALKLSYEQKQTNLIRIYVPHFSESFNLPCPNLILVNLNVDITYQLLAFSNGKR